MLLSPSPCPYSTWSQVTPEDPTRSGLIVLSNQWVDAVGSPEERPKNTSAESISPTHPLIQKRGKFPGITMPFVVKIPGNIVPCTWGASP